MTGATDVVDETSSVSRSGFLSSGRPTEHASRWLLTWRAVFVIAAVIGVPAFYAHWMPAPSVDEAHHYALVRTLMNEWFRWRVYYDYLAEMSYYPPLSHYIAALAGTITGSTFTGMIYVGYASVAVFYIALLALVRRTGLLPFFIACGLLAALAGGLDVVRVLVGNEIVQNYFYAQLVGAALAMLALGCIATIDEGDDGIRTDLLVWLAIQVIIFAHLMPALHLAGAYGLILLLNAVKRPERQFFWRIGFYTILLLLTPLINPAARSMLKIAEHEGGVVFGRAVTVESALLIAVGCFLVSGAVLFLSYRKRNAATFLAVFGLACSIIAFLQWAAFALASLGSQYGIVKNVFAMSTIGIANVSVLIGNFLPKRQRRIRWLDTPMLAAAAFGIALAILRNGTPEKLDHLLAFQSFVRANLSKAETGHTIALASDLAPPLNYMITIGDLHFPRNDQAMAILTDKRISPAGIRSIFLNRSSSLYYPGCSAIAADSGFELVPIGCVDLNGGDPSTAPVRSSVMMGHPYSSAAARGIIQFRGWSQPEATHRWSDGPESSLGFAVPAGVPGELCLVLHGETLGKQTITASIAGKTVAQKQFEGGVAMNIPLNGGVGPKRVSLAFSNPHAPGSHDPRKLAFSLQSLVVSPCGGSD